MSLAVNYDQDIPAFTLVEPVQGEFQVRESPNDIPLDTHELAKLDREREYITLDERLPLMEYLRSGWSQRKNNPEPEALKHWANLAEWLCDWALLAEVADAGLALNNLSQAAFIQQAVLAHWQATDYQGALDITLKRLLSAPGDTKTAALRENINGWIDYSNRVCQGSFESLALDELILEPLGHHHARSYLWQYLGSNISELCCLPNYSSQEDWHDWLAEETRRPGKTTFAVLHASYGFIGVVSLYQYQGSGFFYYWIGPDFQGRGYGPKSVRMLLQHAAVTAGLDCCFAQVFRHNQPSIKALESLGFQRLVFEALPPYGNEYYYYLGPQEPEALLRRHLQAMLEFVASDKVIV